MLNAYLTPVMASYLGSLSARLHDAEAGLGIGRDTPIMVMEAAGGLMTVETALAKPVHTILSGPAGGVVAGAHFAALAGAGNVITMDVGGTSTDISLIRNGRPETTRAARIGQIPIRLPTIDINAIGAGGGSIAWIDEGGALRVGPMSAEAVPGPACYGRGGTRPTTPTPTWCWAGSGARPGSVAALRLDAGAARKAIETHIARPLGIDVVAAAVGILRVAHANIVRGIRVVRSSAATIRASARWCRSAVPGRCTERRWRASCRSRLIVPPAPGILCAMGQLLADLRHDLVETHIFPYAAGNAARASAIALRLSDAAERLLAADGVPPDKRSVEVRVEARYVGQSYELPIAFRHSDADGWARLAGDFHAAHRRRFGHADPDAPIEMWPSAPPPSARSTRRSCRRFAPGGPTPAAAAQVSTREVLFEGDAIGEAGGWVSARIFDRDKLLADNVVEGPAVIEEVSATTVLYPGDRARVHCNGALLVECGR